jgi:hypothetical protein
MLKTVYTLDEIKEKVAPIAIDYGVNRILLFGSYSRKTATLESDLDFYIEDKGELRSLLELSGMILELQECFGCKIDLLSGNIEDSALFENIMREGVVIFDGTQ